VFIKNHLDISRRARAHGIGIKTRFVPRKGLLFWDSNAARIQECHGRAKISTAMLYDQRKSVQLSTASKSSA